MKLLIDGDASHQIESAVAFAQEKNIPVHIYCDYNHQICQPYATVHIVEQSPNSADHAILACCQPNDILLTNDIGLAAIALAKGVYVLNNHGYVYTDENITILLNSRHMHKEARRKAKKGVSIKIISIWKGLTHHLWGHCVAYTIRLAEMRKIAWREKKQIKR